MKGWDGRCGEGVDRPGEGGLNVGMSIGGGGTGSGEHVDGEPEVPRKTAGYLLDEQYTGSEAPKDRNYFLFFESVLPNKQKNMPSMMAAAGSHPT